MSEDRASTRKGTRHPLALGLFLLGAITLALRDVISSAFELLSTFVGKAALDGLVEVQLTPAVLSFLAVLSLVYGTVGLIEGLKALKLAPVRRSLGFLAAAMLLCYASVLIGHMALFINLPLIWIATLFVEFYVFIAICSCLAKSLERVPEARPSPPRAVASALQAPVVRLSAGQEKQERDVKPADGQVSAPRDKRPTAEEKRLAQQEADYWRFVQRMPMRQRVLYL